MEMTEVKLKRTASVLEYDGGSSDGLIAFRHPDEEHEQLQMKVRIPQRDWIDMGEPDEITVTIEPGNALQRRLEGKG